MSSMTKVMQRIQEDQAGSGPPDEALVTPPPLESVAELPEPAVSGFVPQNAANQVAATHSTAAPAVAETVSQETRAWDAQRVDPVVIAFHDRYSAVCEQFRSVRARLLTMNTARAPLAVAITSAVPGEGKSVTTINLAMVMAEGGEQRILVLDADLRRGSLAALVGADPTPGLAEVLRGEVRLSEALQPTPLPNLKFLPAGNVRQGACAELLGGPGVTDLLHEIRQSFAYAFIDTPPVTTVSDVSLLAPHCDGALLVLQMRRTPEPAAQLAVRTLQANHVNIMGCLLSRCHERPTGYHVREPAAYQTN